MSEDEIVDQTRSYESAAKDIEQEKKMVAALKRLSISNMMSYDPDLPIEDMEYQYQYQQQNDDSANKSPPKLSQVRRSSSLSHNSSLKGRPSPSEDAMLQIQGTVEDNASDQPQQEQELDTETLLWVPANLHPEVDPEQFKIHVKTTVGEIMERKSSRKNSLSRHSSLSSSFLADDREETNPSEPETPEKNIQNNNNLEAEQQSYQEKRFSNPSLRDLSFELENLSRIAGMDSTDAVTIARTLSSSSLGYTDVEKQAFDELSSPPHVSPNNSTRRRETDTTQNKAFVDPESPTSRKTVNRLPQEYAYDHSSQHQQHTQQLPRQHQSYQMPKSQFSPNDFSLKRSRRLDYRKLSNPSASGSSLQNNKAGKLAELRNNLNSPSQSPVTHQYHLPKQPEHKSKSKQRNARDSQLLFSYRNPNVPPEAQSSNDSPYPNSASSSSPLEQQFNTHKFSQHNLTAKRISHIKSHKDQYGLPQKQGYSRTSSRSSSGGSGNKSIQSFEKEKARPIQSPPTQPFPSHTINKQKIPPPQNQYRSDNGKHHHRSHGRRNNNSAQQIPSQSNNYVFQLQIPKTRSEGKKLVSQTDLIKKESVPRIKISKEPSNNITENKSTQLNQNLDLLRSEINEFKESLTKIDSPASSESRSISDSDLPESSDNNESDFSFEASYQNISYEDSLGIEKDVLKELNREKITNINDVESDLEYGKANPFVSSPKQKLIQEPVSEFIGREKNDNNEELLKATDFDIDFDQNENKDAIELSAIDQEPLINEIADIPDEEFISRSNEPISQASPAGEVQNKKSFGLLPNHSSSSFNSDTSESKKSLKKKKSWPWLKERSASFSTSDGNKLPSLPEAKSPSRSFSTPETPTKKRQEQEQIVKEVPKAHDVKPSGSIGKENMISKFFKKKRSNSSTSVSSSSDVTNMETKPGQDSGVTVDYESDSEAKKNLQGKLKGGIFKKMNRNKMHEKEKERLQSLKSTSVTSLVSSIDKGSSTEDLLEPEASRETKNLQDSGRDSQYSPNNVLDVGKQKEIERSSELRTENDEETLMNYSKGKERETEKTKPKIKTNLLGSRKEKALRKSDHVKTEISKQDTEGEPDQVDVDDSGRSTVKVKTDEEKEVSRSALDIQEKLKKSIKRTSKANQPIEFTDSAFGFPLPPPSQSTLVMLDYRFPVHVERAIYRLSHLKLANPKRSLREQVLLSNFMYAYLNLVDHTLHLEQLNNSSENTTEVVDDTKELNFATDDLMVSDDELEETKNELDSDQVSIDLDIVDLSNTSATRAETE